MSYQLTVDYPENLPDILQESREEFEKEAKLALFIKLFEMKKISSGMAAQYLGINRAGFLANLSRFGVSMIDLTTLELSEDIKNA